MTISNLAVEAGSRSRQSRDYVVMHPDGHEEMIHGLKAFCTQWGLHQSGLTLVARGRAHQHKGFTIRYAVEPRAPMPGRPRLPLPYVVTHPDGRDETIVGLREFCEAHELYPGHMTLVAQGKQGHHKGYGCRYAAQDSRGVAPPLFRVAPLEPTDCEVCGESFESKVRHAKYCPDCREEATLAHAKEYKRVRSAQNRYKKYRERMKREPARPTTATADDSPCR
jgi:hypothetical protein